MNNYPSIFVTLVIIFLGALLPPPTVGQLQQIPTLPPHLSLATFQKIPMGPTATLTDNVKTKTSTGFSNLCTEMGGHCQAPHDKCSGMNMNNMTLGMNINSMTLGTKYCGLLTTTSFNHYACCAPSGQVFKADIENSLSYALRLLKPNLKNTTDTYTELNSTTCADIKEFINIIHIYLNIDQHIQNHTYRFIESLNDALNVQGDNFDFAWLHEKLNDIQNLSPSDTFINGKWQPSVSCHNIYEGNCFWRYTCGLWNIFHTLTVSADNSNLPQRLEVLGAIHGYVVNFLGCDICGPHFGHMYDQTIVKYGDSIVDTTDKAILWLWCAHNVVNQRHTSHPIWQIHPQFPIKSVCPSCWNGTTTCPELFCEGNTGVGKCFKVQEDLDITYDPFSIPYVLVYLKGLYGGSYSDLKTNTVWQPLDFDPEPKCKIYN